MLNLLTASLYTGPEEPDDEDDDPDDNYPFLAAR